jgi:dipeptide/tripeptide permease
MQPIEIRQSKKKLISFIVIMFVSQIGLVYLIYFSGNYNLSTTLKVAYAGMLAALIYFLYLPVRKLIKNEPVITLTKSDITINVKRKPVTYLWSQIQGWHLEKDKENSNRYLILETTEGKKSAHISWLEKKPAEIEELIISYSGKASRK